MEGPLSLSTASGIWLETSCFNEKARFKSGLLSFIGFLANIHRNQT